MDPILSILVPSITTRAHHLKNLLQQLEWQIGKAPPNAVELLPLVDDGEGCIGGKRNRLLEMARGKYTCFCDDDDHVSGDYVARLLEGATYDPDVITFDMLRYRNAVLVGRQTMSLQNVEYVVTRGPGEYVQDYQYPPTHLCPIRRTIATQIQFPFSNKGEDSEWQDNVRPMLKTEYHVPAVLYHYFLRTDRRGENTNEVQAAQNVELERQLDVGFQMMMAGLRPL